MRYKIKAKDCQLIVSAKASWGEKIDAKALDTFVKMDLRGFLKPKLVNKNVVEYSGPVGISLFDRLKKPVSKREFLFILEQVVVALQKILLNNLSLSWILLDIHYVFINEVTKEIQFLYVPSSEGIESLGIDAFFESIIYSAIPAAEKDTEYVSRFIFFLKAQNSFNPEVIERYIAKEDRSVVNTIKKHNAGQNGFKTLKQRYNGQDGSSDDELTGLLDEDEVADFWGSDDEGATGLLIEDDETDYLDADGATGLLISEDEDEDEGTRVLVSEDGPGTELLKESQMVHRPTLFRVLTEEAISINKPIFRLGKDRNNVDYFVTNNNAVSRSHAEIITRGNQYYVIDLNSKNHTYINNQILSVQYETEIRDGDRLRLGNEEFIFIV